MVIPYLVRSSCRNSDKVVHEYESEKSVFFFFPVMETPTGIRRADLCCCSVLDSVSTGVVEKLRNCILVPLR
jgi:hypothetical protein